MEMWFEGRGDGRLLEVGWGWIGSLLDGWEWEERKKGELQKGQKNRWTEEQLSRREGKWTGLLAVWQCIGVGGIPSALGVGTGYGGVGGGRGGTCWRAGGLAWLAGRAWESCEAKQQLGCRATNWVGDSARDDSQQGLAAEPRRASKDSSEYLRAHTQPTACVGPATIQAREKICRKLPKQDKADGISVMGRGGRVDSEASRCGRYLRHRRMLLFPTQRYTRLVSI